jgi:uncharacterized protein YbaR (Trm112 family)
MQMPTRSSIDQNLLAILRCPASGHKLEIDDEGLTTIDGRIAMLWSLEFLA